MRIMLAILAILGLLASPVAAAASGGCGQAGAPAVAPPAAQADAVAMIGVGMDMDMGAMSMKPHASGDLHAASPAKGHSRLCAGFCCVTGALPAVSLTGPAPCGRTPPPSARVVADRAHLPPGPDQPPRPLA